MRSFSGTSVSEASSPEKKLTENLDVSGGVLPEAESVGRGGPHALVASPLASRISRINPKQESAHRLVKFRFTPSILPPNKVSCLRKSQNNGETNPSLGQGGKGYSDISVTGMCKRIFLGGV